MKLNHRFNLDEFKEWVQEFLPSFNLDIRKVEIPHSFKNVNSILTLGESELGVRVFVVESEFDPSNKKVSLAKDSFGLLKNYGIANAIIAYYSSNATSWRISLLTSTPVWSEGKIMVKISNPKRHSYIVGESRKVATPNKYLISLRGVNSITELKNRFSLEVVNKEFYDEISKSFTNLVGNKGNSKGNPIDYSELKLPIENSYNQKYLEFAVRLIGRIIFCWFLKEKKSNSGEPLMPQELLSSTASINNRDYYHSILEPIFFEILNKPLRSRKELFRSDIFLKIPYLNGGLFSPKEDDFYDYIESRQIENNKKTLIPDKWFTDLFSILETFNFTIDENTSFDEDISIDPEMLGRIFENLLAEINPETGESARRNTGSYYTPRQIVDYMIDETLLLYLNDRTKIEKSKIKALISYDLDDDVDFPLSELEKEIIINELSSIKILDPACGSGAFPIGILQKIVFILQQVDPQGQLWFKKQLENTPIELKKVIEREFKERNFDYIRKLGVIKDNIYGVDIQPIAIEISRLRCFLTLIVDERIIDDAENRGIEPLPNLDFKFVTANTLIKIPTTSSPDSQLGLFEDSKGIEELREIRNLFFTASGFDKDQLKFQFSQTQKRMLNKLIKENSRGFAELTGKLTSWDPFGHETSDWFDSEWMFGVKDGFDIVIANPPYIDSEGMINYGLEKLRNYISENYKLTKGNWDIYIAFYEFGFNVLKNEGILTFITPDKWTSKPFGIELRKSKIKNMYSILTAGRKVFESAKVDSIVSIFYNKKIVDKLKIYKFEDGKVIHFRDYDKTKLGPSNSIDGTYTPYLDLLDKIDKNPLLSNFVTCENACATSDAYKLAEILTDGQNISNFEELFRVINTGTIDKYTSKWGKKEMTYLGKKYLTPVILKEKMLSEFPNSYSRKSLSKKIIMKGLNLLDACIDLNGNFVPGKTTLVICSEDINQLKLIMAYLNSPISIFYLKQKYPASSYNQGTTFTKEMINNLPYPKLNTQDEKEIIDIVNKIIDTDKEEIKIEFQKKINNIFYSNLSLDEKEINIIEGF